MTTETMMTGTEKQIAWATDIRTAAMARLAEYDAALDRIAAEEPEGAELVAIVRAKIHGETSATWWIDHKALGTDLIGIRAAKRGIERAALAKYALEDAYEIARAVCERTMYEMSR